jgi:hypothetical protein
MIAAFHERIAANPTQGHGGVMNDYGYYVNTEYTNSYGYTFSSIVQDTYGNSCQGAYGYIHTDEGNAANYNKVIDYFEKHGLASYRDTDPQPIDVVQELDAGRPVYASTEPYPDTYHAVVIKGWEGGFNFKVHDPWVGADQAKAWSEMNVRFFITAAPVEQPTVTSCDAAGTEKYWFARGEDVYVTGSGLTASQSYKIWIQSHPVVEADSIASGEDPSEAAEDATSNSSGDLVGQPVLIWSIPTSASPTHEEWDIIIDLQDDGSNTGKYNNISDGIDSLGSVGIVAPVPELSTIILVAVGLIALSGYLFFRRRWRLSRSDA